ncbi:multicopper oxidase CueO [Vibrio viridaestus]|uniref:Multicopper oxidase CueO n=1 Tax=Vibrio viridaestus TaxID=2487322 RepID=A0A3N9TGB4_9VIBR|nr:multicopper oxidase CueO [Vibrio viridaestus]RQW63199.1 multicopper oxidase CueO [Vibrio viridaestus]
MKRRDVLRGGAALGMMGLIPLPFRFALANTLSRPNLPVPSILTPDGDGYFHLITQEGHTRWDETLEGKTYGVNGPILGPTIRVKQDDVVKIKLTNRLNETTTMHWHGLLAPGDCDGGPQQMVKPGESWKTEFRINQPAATCWYHPHPHHATARQVAMGIGGMFIIDDKRSEELPLPKEYGVDDIPLVLQDKRLTDSGDVDYTLDPVIASVGWFGNTMLTNGVIEPQKEVPKGWVRLRLLNGCNARVLAIATSDKRPMYVIASDGGLLSSPVKQNVLPIMMGERFDIIIDTSNGKPFQLIALPTNQIGMTLPPFDSPVVVLHCNPTLPRNNTSLPNSLADVPDVDIPSDVKHRTIQLTMNHQLHMYGMSQFREQYEGGRGMMGMMSDDSEPTTEQLLRSNSIDNKPYEMGQPAFDVKQGQYEVWHISGMMLHPFHVHGTQFRIISENGVAPELHRQGWKDTVLINGSESKILVRFDHTASQQHAYMAHCHLLEHEDTGMMMSFTVS